jgi:hypothetical protein
MLNRFKSYSTKSRRQDRRTDRWTDRQHPPTPIWVGDIFFCVNFLPFHSLRSLTMFAHYVRSLCSLTMFAHFAHGMKIVFCLNYYGLIHFSKFGHFFDIFTWICTLLLFTRRKERIIYVEQHQLQHVKQHQLQFVK